MKRFKVHVFPVVSQRFAVEAENAEEALLKGQAEFYADGPYPSLWGDFVEEFDRFIVDEEGDEELINSRYWDANTTVLNLHKVGHEILEQGLTDETRMKLKSALEGITPAPQAVLA